MAGMKFVTALPFRRSRSCRAQSLARLDVGLAGQKGRTNSAALTCVKISKKRLAGIGLPKELQDRFLIDGGRT